MKINRLMQMVFVSGNLCAALPAFASPPVETHDPAALCDGDSDDGDDGDDGDKGHDGDDGDGDDGDDGDGDSGEAIEL